MHQPPGHSRFQLAMEGETDIVVRRDFTHAPARVWRALTEPALIRQWMGQGAMTRCEIDLREGGSFHYEWPDFRFSGPIHEVDAPRRMRHVELFSGDPAYRTEVTTDLVAQGTGTRMTVVMRYADAKARAAAIAQGFTDGLDDVYGGIDALTP